MGKSAQDNTEIEILSASMSVDSPARGAMFGNLMRLKNAWVARPGFGQMFQADTLAMTPTQTLGDPPYSVAYPWGYQKVLGSYPMLTNFGHKQIVTVLLARAYLASEENVGTFQNCYAVRIYDETTDESHEELLFVHSAASINTADQMQTSMPFYNETPNVTSKTLVVGVNERPSFAEYRDSLFFCAPNMGIWCYTPIAPSGIPKRVQQDMWRGPYAAAQPLGESSRIAPVIAAPGLFTDVYAYLDTGSFPSATATCVLNNQLVYASQRNVYFAEPGKPGSVPAISVLTVACQSDIVAIAQNNGYLYIMTRESNEVWCFQPGAGMPLPGRLTQLTDSVGCLNPSAITRRESTLCWASTRGIHTLASPMSVITISDQISPLFYESIGNPVQQFYQAAGADDLTMDQPPMSYDWTELDGVSLDYDPLLRILFVCVPAQNYVLCIQDGDDNPSTPPSYFFWTFDSCVQVDGTQVGVNRAINNPQLLCLGGDVYSVSGLDGFAQLEGEFGWGTSYSYAICKMNRGGSPDRTNYASEDQRNIQGYFQQHGDTSGRYLVLDRPVEMPKGYRYPKAVATASSWVYPIRMWSPEPVTKFHLEVVCAGWTPVLWAGHGGIVDFILPPERIASVAGYTSVLWDSGTSTLTIDFNASGVPTGPLQWTTWPYLNAASDNEEPLLFIGFVPVDRTVANPGLLFNSVVASINDVDCPLFGFQQAYFIRNTDDNLAQPVDWWAKSAQIGIDGAAQLLTRGMFVKMLTRGQGVPVGRFANTTWTRGLLNALGFTDWKDWASQIIDMAGQTTNAQPVFKKSVVDPEQLAAAQGQTDEPIRARLGVGNGEVRKLVYNYLSTWGDASDATKGNTLTADESYDTIAVSAATKGEHLSWLLFGHLWNRADGLTLGQAKAVVKQVAGRRRYGR